MKRGGARLVATACGSCRDNADQGRLRASGRWAEGQTTSSKLHGNPRQLHPTHPGRLRDNQGGRSIC